MSLVSLAPSWLVWTAGLTLVIAAIQDMVTLRISNFLPLALLALALVAIGLVGPEISVWQNALVFVAMLAVGTVLFATGKFGGGDVKLLAAIGLWFPLMGALTLLASVFIAGGLLAMLVLGARMFVRNTENARVAILRRGSGIPYGVAVAIGALFVFFVERA